MNKFLKVTKSREMKLDGSFLRYNLSPLYPLPDDVVVRWVGQNKDFGIVEVISEKDSELEMALKLMPSLEEIEYDETLLPEMKDLNAEQVRSIYISGIDDDDIDKENEFNIAYGDRLDLSLLVKKNYINAVKAKKELLNGKN